MTDVQERLQPMTQAFVAADTRSPVRDWTISDLLDHAAAAAGDRIAVKDGALHWTYGELVAHSRRLARFLQARFAPGARVTIWGTNSGPWLLFQLAAARAGLVLVTLNPALRGPEVEALLAQSKCCGIILDREFRGSDLPAMIAACRDALPLLHTVLHIADWSTYLAEAPQSGTHPPVIPTDTALILFTSGTTGKPKGVTLHHRGIVNNALLGSERYELPDGLAWLGVLPFFHVGGSVTTNLGCLARLATNIIVNTFEPGHVLHLLESERVAWFPCVPTMVIAMVEHANFATTDLSALRLVLTGGTMITPDFVRLVEQRFKVGVQVMFGQTEAGGAMSKTLRSDPIETIAATVGRPYPQTEMRIADVQTGQTVAAGVIGEIRLRSPFMTTGYFENPQATAAVFDDAGYLRTGDLGTLDERGYLRVTGRLKEMIIRGGENIYPREIEDRLGAFPGVAECAVVGVPHPRWGEEVAVAIRCHAGDAIDLDDARQFLLDRIARHKVPKLWKLVPEFPRTPSGKIQKFTVAEWFEREQSA
jgi:fatty-acyl-CoA synthase